MRRTFYCVMSEFYQNGKVQAAMISKERKALPKSSFRKLPFMDAYTNWFEDKEEAEEFLADIKSA